MLCDILEQKLSILVDNITKNTEKYLNTKGVFIIVALIENSKYADTLRSHLTSYTKVINGMSHLKGVELLKELLN